MRQAANAQQKNKRVPIKHPSAADVATIRMPILMAALQVNHAIRRRMVPVDPVENQQMVHRINMLLAVAVILKSVSVKTEKQRQPPKLFSLPDRPFA